MHVVIAGGSGFLGRALCTRLAAAGHRVQVLTRQTAMPASRAAGAAIEPVSWIPDGSVGSWARVCAGADAVVNLAGESIGDKRWSYPRKAELIASRMLPTRSLVGFMSAATAPPAVLLSSSAIGFYGDRWDEPLTETAHDGEDFLAELAFEWEREALKARSERTRVALIRTGIVLDPRAGALAKMLPPFRLFAGGPFGSGRQYMSWIHRDDWVSLAAWMLETPAVDGPVNAVAPNPVTNAVFARALGLALHRPAFLPVPGFVLKAVLGEMAQALLLSSQRVLPARALAGGFRFAFETIDAALADLLA
jgi:hypothetical protein